MLANAFAHVLSTPGAIAEADMRTRKHRGVGLVLISLMSLSSCRKSDKKTRHQALHLAKTSSNS